MAICTALHAARIVAQISENLIGLQLDIRNNAGTHMAMAAEQSQDLAVLQGFVADCVTEYLKRLTWVSDLLADAARKSRLLGALAKMGMMESDITDMLAPLHAAVVSLRDAPRTSLSEISAACDEVMLAVGCPDSLWPE